MRMLEAICQLEHLTSLALNLPAELLPLPLDGLHKLHTLRFLSVRWPEDVAHAPHEQPLSAAGIQSIRSLRLRGLRLGNDRVWPAALARAILADGSRLELQDIGSMREYDQPQMQWLDVCADPEIVQLLLLPLHRHLHTLRLFGVGRCLSLQCLAQLPNLAVLMLAGCGDHPQMLSTAALHRGLESCPRLQLLHLRYLPVLDSDLLGVALSRMPHLQSLTLSYMDHLRSLRFLDALSAPVILAQFDLQCVYGLPIEELSRFLRIRSLRFFSIRHCYRRRNLDVHARNALKRMRDRFVARFQPGNLEWEALK
jgi:hypothetical protein